VLAAARYVAEVLTNLQSVLSSHERYGLPEELAAFVTADLAQAEVDGVTGG
jgi:hypothetical protein